MKVTRIITDRSFLVGLLLMAVAAPASFAQAQQGQRVHVEAVGQAPVELPNAREAAIESALRKAVEVGGGVEVASLSESRDFALLKDVIYTKTAGLVETYKVLLENPDQEGLYTVKISAVISRGSLNTSVAAWKALLRRKGHPRMMVVGSVDKRPFERRLTAELQGLMDRRNMTVIDLEMLSENQRAAAERAARGDLDPKKAAIIAREAGADYFVVAAIEGSQHKSRSYGIDLFRVDSTAILKVVAVDSARVIASEVKTVTRGGRDMATATRQSTSLSMSEAFEAVVGRIGSHWLADVDHRGGAQLNLVIHKCDFDRLTDLCRKLRLEPAIKDVIVDSADAEGRSFVRVITTESAANVATFIRGVDSGMKIRSVTRSQLELAPVGPPPPPAAKGQSPPGAQSSADTSTTSQAANSEGGLAANTTGANPASSAGKSLYDRFLTGPTRKFTLIFIIVMAVFVMLVTLAKQFRSKA